MADKSNGNFAVPSLKPEPSFDVSYILMLKIMSVRMKDIAKDLGVSVITVSKVLRNHPDVGDETRKRVLARVKELNYQLNLAARSLVTGRSYLVGLVVPDLLHPFFAEIAKALSEVLRKSGYYLIVTSSDEDPELEEQEINQLLARRLDVFDHRLLPYYGRFVLSNSEPKNTVCADRSLAARSLQQLRRCR